MKLSEKLLVILSIVLFMALAVSALEIRLIEYDETTNFARIIISNTDQVVYNNITISIDNGPFNFILGRMNPTLSAIYKVTLTPELHNITVSTNQGIFSKEISFAKTKAEVEEELEDLKNERIAQESADNLRKKSLLTSRVRQVMLLIVMIMAVLFGLFAYKRYQKNTSQKHALKLITPKPFFRIRQESKIQPKKQQILKQKIRQQSLRNQLPRQQQRQSLARAQIQRSSTISPVKSPSQRPQTRLNGKQVRQTRNNILPKLQQTQNQQPAQQKKQPVTPKPLEEDAAFNKLNSMKKQPDPDAEEKLARISSKKDVFNRLSKIKRS